MTRLLQVSLMAAVASFAVLPMAASAQTQCAAGRAANGDCANETMVFAAIQAAVIFSQPKISLTAYPVLPPADRLYRYPSQLNPSQLVATPVGPGPVSSSGSGSGGGTGVGASGGGGSGSGGGGSSGD